MMACEFIDTCCKGAFMLKYAVATVGIMLSVQAAATPNGEKQVTIGPIAGVEVGKVRHTSINNLTPDARAMMEADIAEKPLGPDRRFGVILDDAVLYMKNYHTNVKDIRQITKNVTFKLSDVSRSELQKYSFEGAYPEGPTKAGPWSSLTRVFKRDDGVLIMLHEWDYVGDGGGVMIVDELMNARVGEAPARFSVKKSPTGSIVSELMWVTKSRFFTVTVMDDVADEGDVKYNAKWLERLAGNIK
jgi:hypothetical protein